jgi:hypothetical protein
MGRPGMSCTNDSSVRAENIPMVDMSSSADRSRRHETWMSSEMSSKKPSKMSPKMSYKMPSEMSTEMSPKMSSKMPTEMSSEMSSKIPVTLNKRRPFVKSSESLDHIHVLVIETSSDSGNNIRPASIETSSDSRDAIRPATIQTPPGSRNPIRNASIGMSPGPRNPIRNAPIGMSPGPGNPIEASSQDFHDAIRPAPIEPSPGPLNATIGTAFVSASHYWHRLTEASSPFGFRRMPSSRVVTCRHTSSRSTTLAIPDTTRSAKNKPDKKVRHIFQSIIHSFEKP